MATKQTEIPDDFHPQWLEKLDNRTALARAVNDRYRALTADLGGTEHMSYQRRSLAKRAIWMEAVIEQQEAALSRGEDVDQAKLTQAVNSLIGLLKTLGLDRVAAEVPDLHSYLKARESDQ